MYNNGRRGDVLCTLVLLARVGRSRADASLHVCPPRAALVFRDNRTQWRNDVRAYYITTRRGERAAFVKYYYFVIVVNRFRTTRPADRNRRPRAAPTVRIVVVPRIVIVIDYYFEDDRGRETTRTDVSDARDTRVYTPRQPAR